MLYQTIRETQIIMRAVIPGGLRSGTELGLSQPFDTPHCSKQEADPESMVAQAKG